ncbi:MAG: FAD-dependent oxidoreductase [Candidatus Latescibacteria bacterium]|nr:FAD-dependent oxidoreductase [Candidatus Latescibacterota bacterium]
MNPKKYDVVVMGGGPGGSTVAALIAQQGHSVALLEREETPPLKVGESLMPYTYSTFERLGVLEQLKKSAFPRKYSVQFFGRSGRGSAPFYFSENDPHERSTTWQVLRSEFDQMLMDNAAAKGAHLRQGVRVREVLFDQGRAVGVQVQEGDGAAVNLGARVVVDATGQSALIARKLGLKKAEPELKKASIFTHFEGAVRDPGIDEGATLIMHTENRDSWFWYIPLAQDRVSVGVVGDLGYLMRRRGQAQALFDEELTKCPALQTRLESARQVFPVKVTQDFSYRSDRLAGDGWVLVGDAFGFLDPIYSSGVLLALKSGELAADAICQGLEKDDLSAAQLGQFGAEFVTGMEAIRKLVYAFYDRDFGFAEFLKAHPECKQGIIDILSGNVFGSGAEAIFEPMAQMCQLPQDFVLPEVA